uniref:Uncharacterized protein n=1 Tax=Siphoviridae sp. ctzjp2 TaxID=2826532 RepID=A0A8S5QM99_9CAUD|nr:MAG TPA: hypothetical protein [Siphoviridae sp. ctzjp2]
MDILHIPWPMLLSCRCSWSDSDRGQPFFVVLTTLEN